MEKDMALHLIEPSWIPFTQSCFVPSLVDIGPLVLEKNWRPTDSRATGDQKSSLEFDFRVVWRLLKKYRYECFSQTTWHWNLTGFFSLANRNRSEQGVFIFTPVPTCQSEGKIQYSVFDTIYYITVNSHHDNNVFDSFISINISTLKQVISTLKQVSIP